MDFTYSNPGLETLLEQEILSLNERSKKPFIYQFEEGKLKVGYNKRTQKYYYDIDSMRVEEWDTAEEILACIKGFLWNQNDAIVNEILKIRKKELKNSL